MPKRFKILDFEEVKGLGKAREVSTIKLKHARFQFFFIMRKQLQEIILMWSLVYTVVLWLV